MKKNWFVLLVLGSIALGFSSCSDDSEEWRDSNLAFMDRIKDQEGINPLGDKNNGFSGIYYQILDTAYGEKPIVGNVVNVAYKAWLCNDTITSKSVLDSDDSFQNVNEFKFTITDSTVIDAWYLAVQYMPVGSKWRLYVPYNVGYGTTASSDIPAYSTLIFDIYLKKKVSDN